MRAVKWILQQASADRRKQSGVCKSGMKIEIKARKINKQQMKYTN